MTDLLVFSTGTFPASELFVRSCKHFDIEPLIFEASWGGYGVTKIRAVRDFLKRDTGRPFVLFADAHDSLVLDDAKTILDKYQHIGTQIVISTEKTCWPDASISHFFPYPKPPYQNSAWRFINAGGWMGSRESVLAALDEMDKDYVDRWPGDDQRCWQEWYLQRLNRVICTPDFGCQIFQTMASNTQTDFSPMGENYVTKSKPSVLHFNGRIPGRGMWYRQLTGDLGWKGE